MPSLRLPALCLILVLAGQSTVGMAAAKLQDWSDPQGNKFRASPAAVLGPFALFRTDKNSGRRLLLSQLSPADCVRFDAGLTDKPRADRWVDATGTITREMLGNVLTLLNDRLELAEFQNVPEPEFVILFFGTYSSEQSWQIARDLKPEYERMRARFPGLMEAMFFGVRHTETEHNRMAHDLTMPWMIEEYRAVNRLRSIARFATRDLPSLMIVTRDGVPVAFSDCKSKSDMERACLELETLMTLMRPDNRRTWNDRLHYHKAVRQAAFRSGRADPLLVGHQADLAGLRQAGIKTLSADLKIAADGTVSDVSVHPVTGLDDTMKSAFADALQKAAFVPAVENGQFVASSYTVTLEP